MQRNLKNFPVDRLFAGPGEIRSVCRSIDWRGTPLGPVELWPPALRTAIRLCLDSATPSAVLAGPDHQVIYNDAYPPILGLDKHPWALGRSAREVWSESWDRLGPDLQRLGERAEPVERVNKGFLIRQSAKEQRATVTYAYTPIREEDGSVVGALSVANGHARRTADREDFLSFALTSAQMGAWDLDLVDHTIQRTVQHDQIFGYEQLLPQWTYEMFLEHVIPKDREDVERSFQHAVEARSNWSFECRIKRRDGSIRCIWASGRHVVSADGRYRRMAGVIQDITERKAAENTLRAAEARQAFLLKLSDALRTFGDPTDIKVAAAEALGRHLGIAAVGYVEVDPRGEQAYAGCEYNDGRLVRGRSWYRLSDFGSYARAVQAGEELYIETFSGSASEPQDVPAAAKEANIHSAAAIPLIKDSQLVAYLYALHNEPREWPDEERFILRETAERTWATVERARSEAALRESEEKYRALFNSVGEGFSIVQVILDQEGKPVDFKILEVNPAFERLTGLRDVVNKRVREVVPNIDPGCLERFGEVALTGEPIRLENWAGPLGRWFTVHVSRIDSPGARWLVLIFDDITERRMWEDALRVSEAKFSKAFHGSTSAMALSRLDDGTFIEVNDRYTELSRLSRDQLIGKTPLDLNLWKRPEDRAEFVRELKRNGTIRNGEYAMVRADGEEWTGLMSSQISELDGEPIIISSIMDVTEIRRMEEAKRRSEERFRALVTATSYVVYQMSPDWSELRLLHGENLIPGKINDWLEKYVHPDEHAHVMAVVREAMRSKSALELEHRVLRRDGTVGWVFSRAVPITNARGEIVEWFGSASDVTARKEAEMALEEANEKLRDMDRRKNEFLAILSHELRNPLAPIKNSLYILDHGPPEGEQAQRAKDVIERQFHQLSHLVDDLLDVTRITRGKIQLQRDRLELNELVRRTIEDHRTLFEKYDVDVQMMSAPVPIFVEADRNRIAQVIGNLLQNAVKFTPRSGHVTVSVLADPNVREAIFRVKDTGVGLSVETLEHLFEPFRQADTTLDRSKGGLGLGLSLVKGLVELHGGSVDATSDGPGRGAEFTVRLPLDRHQVAVGRTPSVPGPGAHRRVLIIEDNADAAETLRTLLEIHGHEVAIAYTGKDGIASARVFQPDLVLCDVGLPGMDGYAVARTLRADPALKNMRLVAVSGYALPEDVQRAVEAGFEQHLAKPLDFEKLDAILFGE